MSQINVFDEIIVDNFAGGGGASTGIELAASRPVAIAINHDPAAILLHKTNHPYTEHLQASVWDVDPEEVCKGRPVGLAWFSPDCKHFSKAKGAALVDKKIRGLAWIVLRWAAKVRPRVIMLENVEEFQTWGPVRKGKPVKKKAGQTFRKWKQQLTDLGYKIEHREEVAADFGAPTTRKRFVLIARCDGQPIVWPERTHAPRDSEEVRSGKCKPWRSAAEIIDWSLPGYSVFASKQEIKERFGVTAVRPLAKNTMRRIIRGVDKFTIKSGEPFLVECNHGGDRNTRSADEPVNTVTGKYTGGVCQPLMAPYTFSNTGGSVGGDVSEPVHTIRTSGGQILSAANLIQYHTEQSEKVRGQGMEEPIMTVDAANRYGLACANLVEYYGNGNPLDVTEPMHTVTAHDREALTLAHIVEFKGQDIGQHPEKPLRTITASAGEFAEQYMYLGCEWFRVMMPGRNVSIHCMNLPTSKERDGYIGIRDFRGDVIRWMQSLGFIYHSEVCIWKNPVTAMQRTKALGLLHKQIKKDSCMSRQGIPDYVVTFRKPGDNPERVTHTNESYPVSHWQKVASPIWEEYATPTWWDINQSDTLNRKAAKEEKDERHICPLQLPVIERCVELWSNPGDIILDPFDGIGSTGYQSLLMGRRHIGIELKESYFNLAVENCQNAENRAASAEVEQANVFDLLAGEAGA